MADLAGGNARLRDALLDSLVETIIADVAAMQAACKTGDRGRLHAAVHRLKGSGGIVRCRALVECIVHLEAAAEAGDAGVVPYLVSDCTRVGDAVAGALLALRQDHQGI